MNVERTESSRMLLGMFAAGVVCASGMVFIFYKLGLLREFSLVFSTQFLSGREFAMLHGASREVSPSVMILVSFLSDFSSMLIGLPIFVFFYKELKTIPIMTPFMNFSEHITSNKNSMVHKFGMMGLFMVCFIPLQMTGSLATACFAKLLGFTLREILPVVSLASLTASVFWAMTAKTAMKYLGPIQYYIPSLTV